MKSSYVQSSFLEIASGDKTDRLRIVDIGSGGRCRIFQARFMPASYGGGSGQDDEPGSGMDVLSGLTGPRVYGCYSEPYRVDTHNRVGSLFFLDIPPSGILVEDDVYVQGLGLGINFASITYQVG